LGASGAPVVQIEGFLERLYEAFSFDPDGEPNWPELRQMFADGAAFVSPPTSGESPVGVDSDEFLASFQDFIRSSPIGATGYHERVVRTRIDAVGQIAHAWVTFDGFVPGRAPDRRGVDSLQLVLEDGAWKLVSFMTHYEDPDAPLPRRFQPRRFKPSR